VTDESLDDSGSHRQRRRSGGVSMATRLAAAVLLVSLLSLAIATFVGIASGFDLGRGIYEARLTSLNGSGSFDVAAELRSTRSATEALALSPGAATAVGEFDRALAQLPEGFDPVEATSELTGAYEGVYLDTTGPTGSGPDVNEIVPSDSGALYVQTEYSVETVDADTGEVVAGEPADGQTLTVEVVADPGRLADAGDGSAWSEVHSVYHPAYRRIVDDLGLLDLYLIEPEDSRIVYSVGKGPDVGSSLVTGPFGGSVLANTVEQVIDDPAAGAVVSDLSLYTGAPDTVIGVMASPIMDDDTLVGVVAVTYDGSEFTRMLTSPDASTDPDGNMPPDVYLIGADGTLRSDPQSYLDAPTVFVDLSEASGLLSPEERDDIVAAGTTVLTQPAVGSTVMAARTGDEAVAERQSMTGGTVFNTVARVPFDGVEWYTAAEVGVEPAEAALGTFRDILIVGASLFVICIAFLAVAWAGRLMRPVRAISERLGNIDDDHTSLELPERSPVEMHHLAASFDSMVTTLDEQQVALAVAREERLELLRQMLPTAVADRLAKGGDEGVDQVEQASVVVLVVRGLGELVRADGAGTNRDLVDRLHAELDGLAEEHGLDRIKVVGDAYFAACGHDRPFIDHAPRVVTFASDARDAIRSLGDGAAAELDVAVGVDTGPVTVGMTGTARLIYDVWGETVSWAHLLARSAGAGSIVVSDATHSMLPLEMPSEPTEVAGATAWIVSDAAMGSVR
jgi:class 3 adenylate cyclase